ncbi:MAG: metallophosphoesterase [Oscillospiraceae bacterium]|nr:metallophosphoesterase [Oscillospiraceae bacterium]
MKKLVALIIAAAMLISGCGGNPKEEKTEVTIFHATDMHYLSQQLTDNSDAFIEMVKAGDGKMTHYSEQICDAFVADVISQKPDAVLIGGDITFNCEKLSHEDFILKLHKIEQAGIDVLVIPGNHDVEYPFSRGYEGEYSYKADYTTEADFVEYYKDFGPDIAYTVSPDGLSYIAKLGKDIYVAVVYTPQSFMSGVTGIEAETLAWLDTELAKIDKDAKIVAMTHQNIVNHYPDEAFSFSYTIQNNEELISLYDKYGVDVNLSGHIHLQHIEETESGIADIATASMTIRQCHYGVMRITPEKMFYNVQEIDVEGWAEENGSTDENLLNFEEYNNKFYFDSAYQKAYANVAELKLTEEEKDALASMWAEFNVNYFAGTLDRYYPQIMESDGYRIMQENGLGENWSFAYMQTAAGGKTTERSQLHWEKDFSVQ